MENPPTPSAILLLKILAFILNLIVFCIGCISIFGSVAFEINRHPENHPTIDINRTSSSCPKQYSTLPGMDPKSRQRMNSYILTQSNGFLLTIIPAMIMAMGSNVLHIWWVKENYLKSTLRCTDMVLFAMCGILLGVSSFFVFYPVDMECHVSERVTTHPYFDSDVCLKEFREWQHNCWHEWRVKETIATMVLGTFTGILYCAVALTVFVTPKEKVTYGLKDLLPEKHHAIPTLDDPTEFGHRIELGNEPEDISLGGSAKKERRESKKKLDVATVESKKKVEVATVESKKKLDVATVESKKKLEAATVESKKKLDVDAATVFPDEKKSGLRISKSAA